MPISSVFTVYRRSLYQLSASPSVLFIFMIATHLSHQPTNTHSSRRTLVNKKKTRLLLSIIFP